MRWVLALPGRGPSRTSNKTVVTERCFTLALFDQKSRDLQPRRTCLRNAWRRRRRNTRHAALRGLVPRGAASRIRTQRPGRLNFPSCDQCATARTALPASAVTIRSRQRLSPTNTQLRAFYYNGFHCSRVTRGWRVWLAPNAYGCQCCRHRTADTRHCTTCLQETPSSPLRL